MHGCVVARAINPSSLPVHFQAKPQQLLVPRTETLALARALLTARKSRLDFDDAVAKERGDIQDAFRQMQKELDGALRKALESFDEKTSASQKRLAIQEASIEVYVNQAAAALSPNTANLSTIAEVLPAFSHIPLEDFQRVLATCWTITLPPRKDWLETRYTRKVLEEKVAEINILEKMNVEVMKLAEMANVVKTALNSAVERQTIQGAAALATCVAPSTAWSGIRTAVYPFDFNISGIAVNGDASLLAISNYNEHCIVVHSLQSGQTLRRFGRMGNGCGQFYSPMRLCFTPTGTLLVADSNNKRVQEVTITGDHVRFIQSDAITTNVVHVVCNSDRIVATQQSGRNAVCVFDLTTGDLLHHFAIQPTFWDTAFAHDCETLLIANTGGRRVSACSLTTGEILYNVGDASTFELIGSALELPDGRFVAADAKTQHLLVFSRDSLVPLFVIKNAFTAVASALQLRWAYGRVFVSNNSCVYCFG